MMMKLKATVAMKIEVLSPIHIGNGEKLHRDLDFVIRQGSTYVIDESRFIEWAVPNADEMSSDLLSMKPGDLLANEKDLDALPLWRYVMQGKPEKNEINAHIKDVYGHVYLPGSSIKGMLRTAFLRGLYVVGNKRPDLTRLARNRQWAGQAIERAEMGRNPNYDLFRAIYVADSEPVGLDQLRVLGTSVYPTGKSQREGVVIDAECIRDGAVFETTLTLDRYGFDDQAAAQMLDWQGKGEVIGQVLVAAMKDSARVRLNQERRYFKDREDTGPVRGFYRQLVDIFKQLDDNQFIAQIGWGGGWQSKTLNDLLRQDERRFAGLVQDYRLKAQKSRDFRAGDDFPVSRMLVRQNGRPVRPLGWVRVTLG